MALTNAETVALVLNGKPLGEKSVDKYEMVLWDVPYEPGKLEAVAKTDGEEVARFAVETTGPPVALQLIPDRSSVAGDGCDALPVTIEAVDAEGRSVPTANLPVRFELDGPGKIIGLGNGDPTSHEPEKGDRRSLFNGLAQVIVQSDRQSAGKLKLRAIASGLETGEAVMEVARADERPEVLPSKQTYIVSNWRMSPTMDRPPSSDWHGGRKSNGWAARSSRGNCNSLPTDAMPSIVAQFKPRAVVRKQGGDLVFRDLVGKAQVWIDGKLAGEKHDVLRKSFTVRLSPGNRERAVDVVIEASPGSRAGLGGLVTIE